MRTAYLAGATSGLPSRWLGAGLLLASLALGATAQAQHAGVQIGRPYLGQRITQLNLHAGVSLRGVGAAAGLRIAIPIMDNGPIPSIDNAVYFTIGGDLFFERCVGGCGGKDHDDDYGVAVAIPLTGRWQFNFDPNWSAYGEVGPNLYLHSGWLGDGHFPGVTHVGDAWFAMAVGGKWHFSPTMSLTLSLGAPYSHIGLDMAL